MTNRYATCQTLDDLRKAYRRDAMIHHPDRGGDTVTMQAINRDYAERYEVLRKAHNSAADEHHQVTEPPEEFIRVVSYLLRMDGLTVELCGRWLWITGDTMPHKDRLKAIGCRWAPKKRAWSWHYSQDDVPFSRGKKTMDAIRRKYGSERWSSTRTTSRTADDRTAIHA